MSHDNNNPASWGGPRRDRDRRDPGEYLPRYRRQEEYSQPPARERDHPTPSADEYAPPNRRGPSQYVPRNDYSHQGSQERGNSYSPQEHAARHDHSYERRQHDQYDLPRHRHGGDLSRPTEAGYSVPRRADPRAEAAPISPMPPIATAPPPVAGPAPSTVHPPPGLTPPNRPTLHRPDHLSLPTSHIPTLPPSAAHGQQPHGEREHLPSQPSPTSTPISQLDDSRSYIPLPSEPVTPAPATPIPHTATPPYGNRSHQPAVLPPHLRPHQQSHERRRYTPSPLSNAEGQYVAGQFESVDDLPAAAARMTLSGSATPLSDSPGLKGMGETHTGSTGKTGGDTQTTLVSTRTFARTEAGTPSTRLGTPDTLNSKGSGNPAQITQHLEATPLTSFYVRPGYGKEGRPITVESNYFMVRAIGNRGKIIHHYDVGIEPVVRTTNQKFPRTLLRSVWEQLAIENETREEWNDAFAAAAFDGRRNAYSPVQFPVPDCERVTLTVSLASTREVARQKDTSSDDEFRRFRVTFRKVAEIDLEAVMRFCRADSAEKRDANAEEACLTGVMAANILLRDVPSKTYTQVGATGQKFYTLEGARPLPSGAVVLNGFMQSFRYSNSGYPLLNIDLGFSAFLMSGPCLEVIAKILGPGMRGPRRGPPQPDQIPHSLELAHIGILKRKLRGARFTVTHRPSPRLHTVITVTSLSAQEIQFTVEGKDGQPERRLNVAEYYHEYYASRLRYPGLPCIQYGKRAFVPLEFVRIEDFNSLPPTNLNADQIAEMIKISAMRPPDRKATIMQWRERLAHEKQPKIARWGLQVNQNMVQLAARVLSPPEVKYGRHKSQRPRDGSWNLRQVTFIRDGLRPLVNWSVVSFERYTDEDTMKRWVTYLVARLRQLGVDVQNPSPPILGPVDPRTTPILLDGLKLAARKAFLVNNQPPQLICCILPGKEAWLYETIKRMAFTELHAPVATQCMQAAKIKNERGLMAYTDNLCMKILQKLGGLSHQVSLKDMPGMVYGKTMLLGADLGHPPFRPNSQEPTVACSVATYNADCDAYSAQIRLQEGRSEIIADLSTMIEEHLRIFAKENGGEYPERILVFRDGISEGQYAAALQYEHNAIVTACNRVLPGYRPRILVCVCARRHNTRFFAKNMSDADRSGNLPAGLVVDKSVTHPFAFDFFLQAHAGLVGTARPTHYICLIDELGTTPDQLQKLCNALSYSFARCTKAVSLVPVCYMADLVCRKARLIVQSNENSIAPSEYSGTRAQSRYGGGPAPSVIGSDATSLRRQRFEEKHDIMHIQKLLAKNEELSRVAWWM